MTIALFNEITTEDALQALEANGEKYKGLYVDMEDKKQRKYVKDNASLINDLLKRLDRSRIDKTKSYKQAVETEALHIRTRLENANAPFTLLIDSYNEHRKQILADKKAREEAQALAIQIEADHELAILQYADHLRQVEHNRLEQERLQREHDEHIKAEAIKQAELDSLRAIEQAKQDKIDAENRAIQAEEDARLAAEKAELDKANAIQAEKQRQLDEQARLAEEQRQREANKAHKAAINNEVLRDLMTAGLDNDQAITVITAIARGQVSHTKINY